MIPIETLLDDDAALLDRMLSNLVYSDDAAEKLTEAERYSLLAGGKRIRPILTVEICRMFGGTVTAALPFATAVEMVHTYSLIHDDLPCMDDDDLRRGKPTNHKVFGEATAVLAGDALLTDAFGVIANAEEVSPKARVEAVRLLSSAAGTDGMVSGQVMDMLGETKHLTEAELLHLYRLKTGALLRAAAGLGCLAAGLTSEDEAYRDVALYAERVGLVFQMIDDVLDATATQAELGKTVGSDATNGKTTFLSFETEEEIRASARRLTDEAIAAVQKYDGSETLTALAEYLLKRSH